MIIVLRRAVAVLTFILLAATPSNGYAPYLKPQHLVDIGQGRRMNLYCTGEGSPTVILDTDQDSSTVDWRFVQPAIAKSTRVCSYDAAGLGFSDVAPAPRDAKAYMHDLRALLKRGGVNGPYVLVGYAFSALSDQLYVASHQEDVVGLIFVDPMVPYRNRRFAKLVTALSPLADEGSFIASLRMCRHAASAGKLHVGTAQFKACMWSTGPTDPALPNAVQHVLQAQWQRPGAWDDLIFAAEADDRSSAEVTNLHSQYGNMPLIVLTSDVHADLKGAPLSPRQFETLSKAYKSWHEQIASLSQAGREFVVPGSTASNMPVDHAAAVVSAVNEVLQKARASKAQRPK